MKCLVRFAFAVLIAGIALSPAVRASSGGISGFSGAAGSSTCSACHFGGSAPIVTILGPTTVAPNSVSQFSLVITGGQQNAGGMDVSVTGGVLLPADGSTRLLGLELVHSSQRLAEGDGSVRWDFQWQAPAQPGVVIFSGAGLSTNRNSSTTGDGVDTVSRAVTVAAATPAPGETSGPTLQPLQVDSVDASGNMSLRYQSGCEVTDNSIYYGPLDQVSTYVYGGEVCDIGTGGTLSSFNPGIGSFFFMVVGHNGSDEGSYGRARQLGIPVERPPFATSLCGLEQDLSDTCSP